MCNVSILGRESVAIALPCHTLAYLPHQSQRDLRVAKRTQHTLHRVFKSTKQQSYKSTKMKPAEVTATIQRSRNLRNKQPTNFHPTRSDMIHPHAPCPPPPPPLPPPSPHARAWLVTACGRCSGAALGYNTAPQPASACWLAAASCWSGCELKDRKAAMAIERLPLRVPSACDREIVAYTNGHTCV